MAEAPVCNNEYEDEVDSKAESRSPIPVVNSKEKDDSKEEKSKRLKTNQEIVDVTKKKPTCDLATFSKLTLSQQVLKRYEMLNKPVPTQNQLVEAKLKKKLGDTDSNAKNGQSQANPNVPHLILDTSTNSTQKVPIAMRQRHLKVIFDNVRPLHADIREAALKASENEKSIYDRAKNKTIYINLVANLIKSLRSQLAEKQHEQKTVPNCPSSSSGQSIYKYTKTKPNESSPGSTGFSHEMILSGPKASRVNYTIGRAKTVEIKDLSGINILLYLLK